MTLKRDLVLGLDQVQQMVRSLLRLKEAPEPYDASDALAVAICHAQSYRYEQATSTQ